MSQSENTGTKWRNKENIIITLLLFIIILCWGALMFWCFEVITEKHQPKVSPLTKTTAQNHANIVGATPRCSWTFDLCCSAEVSLWSALVCFDVDSKDLRLVKLTSAAHASLFSFADVLKGTNTAGSSEDWRVTEVKGQPPSWHRHQFWCPGWQPQVLIRVLNVITAQYRPSRLTRRPALAFALWWLVNWPPHIRQMDLM